MNAINAQLQKLEQAFARLTQREQVLVAITSALVMAFFFFITAFMFGGAISRAEARIESKTHDLNYVLRMQGEYKTRKEDRKRRLSSLRGRTKLVKIVERAASSAGVEIGQLRPEEGEPDSEGIVESRVELRAQKISIDRLQKFMTLIEKSPGVVVIKRLKVNKPYRKETLDIDMVVATFKVKKG